MLEKIQQPWTPALFRQLEQLVSLRSFNANHSGTESVDCIRAIDYGILILLLQRKYAYKLAGRWFQRALKEHWNQITQAIETATGGRPEDAIETIEQAVKLLIKLFKLPGNGPVDPAA